MNVIIVGGGKVGAYLTGLLLSGGHRVKVIEARRKETSRLQHDLPRDVVVLGSGTDPDVLEAAGIHNADVVAAVTGEDENNLVATSLARYEFHVPRTIARVNNPKNAWMFTPDMGVDVALNQADLMGHLIAEEMSLGDMVTLLKLRKGQFSGGGEGRSSSGCRRQSGAGAKSASPMCAGDGNPQRGVEHAARRFCTSARR